MRIKDLEVGKKYKVAKNDLGDHFMEIGTIVTYKGKGYGNFPRMATIFESDSGQKDWLLPSEVEQYDE